jgi:hypothetical protein
MNHKFRSDSQNKNFSEPASMSTLLFFPRNVIYHERHAMPLSNKDYAAMVSSLILRTRRAYLKCRARKCSGLSRDSGGDAQ